jgi:hypothetical protein
MSSEPIPYSLGYLIAEIEDLAKLAETNGLGTLAYLLEVALLEAKRQAQQVRDDSGNVPDGEKWKPV